MSNHAMSRRGFLAGIATAGLGAGAIGLAGCAPNDLSQTGTSAPAAESGSGHAWLNPAPPLPEVTSEETYDIAIIGAGIAGCTAAQAAAEAGASVVVVDKAKEFTAHGADIGAVGTKAQKEAGIEIDKALAARLIYQWGQSEANYYLIKNYVEKSGEILDYYIDMATAMGYFIDLPTEQTARSDWNNLEDRFKQFRTAHRFMRPETSDLPEYYWPTANFVSMVSTDAEKNGAVFQYNTKAEQLIKEGDRITGVIVSTDDGYRRINASKGVILATGGITNNDEMKECFCPISLNADQIEYFPIDGDTGDGLVMGKWVGAALSGCYPAPIIHPVNLAVMGPGFDTCWLTVNRDGMRYCCEVGYEPIVTNARMNSIGNKAWAIWDSHFKEHAQKQEPVKSQSFIDGLDEAVEAAVADGAFYKGETLQDLADAIGVPYETLKKTVNRYNEFCDKGEDSDFGVPARFLSSVKDGPFYASNVSAWLLALPYGLRVDQNSQVLDEQDNPIEGLFAIGNVQGEFFANSYPVSLPGTSHGRGVTFGHLVGKALARGETIDGYAVGF